MNKLKYTLKSLWYYKKQNFALLLVSILSTAVLTGALIIGDSVKFSLKEMVDLRLGKADYAMNTGERYIRADLAHDISSDLKIPAAALVQTNGIAVQPEENHRVNQVQIYGIDSQFWTFSDSILPNLETEEAFVSENLAARLNLKPGSYFLLSLQKSGLIPANAPFVSDDEHSLTIRLKVKQILRKSQLGNFSLKSNQVPPYNVFLSRHYLARQLNLQGMSNLLLLANHQHYKVDEIQAAVNRNWKLRDLSLQIKSIDSTTYEINSDRVFIENHLADAIGNIDLPKQSLFSYFVNSLASAHHETPYSFLTSVDRSNVKLEDNEMIISDWLAKDLRVKQGDSIRIKYFVIGDLRKLVEKTSRFQIKSVLPLASSFWDKSMMPDFPGLTDAGSCNEWEAGVPIDFSKIRDKDEQYWKDYRGTPKAMIAFSKAQELWGNKYGACTAIRIQDSKISLTELINRMRDVLHPKMLNLHFQAVKNEGNRAANNMVDFGGLFLSLSFFIIAAAVILSVLIYSLHIDNRSRESGILLGIGFHHKHIVQLRIYESLLPIVLGAGLGVVGGMFYNSLLLKALNTVWQDVVRTNMIHIFIQPITLFTGFICGIAMSLLTVILVLRKKRKLSIITLLRETNQKKIQKRKIMIWKILGWISLLGTMCMVIYAFLASLEQNAELLLSAGGLFLIALAAFFNLFLEKQALKSRNTTPGLFRLAIQNAARNSKRSLAIVVLLALGSFSVLITGANRKTFVSSEHRNQSGSGGYEYWLESTLPVLSDLNSKEGQVKAGFDTDELSDKLEFVQCKVQNGDDASCLNLNQVSKPQIIAVDPAVFDQRKAFSFAQLHSSVDASNPWLALNQDYGDAIPAYADQTVILWGLKKAVGDRLVYQDEYGKDIQLLLVGGLANSVFQGNIIISDEQFQKHFPSVSGSKIILADSHASDSLLLPKMEDRLQDLGLSGMKTSERLAAFYSVENTYLSMFMFLGGLGVIIGTIGFAMILLRNVWERKKELAVLKAMGYSNNSVFALLFYENVFLLLAGLLGGVCAALIGVLPSLFSPAFQMPYLYVFLLISAICFSGLLSILFPLWGMRKQNLAVSLKEE